jgi:hypothetical protein
MAVHDTFDKLLEHLVTDVWNLDTSFVQDAFGLRLIRACKDRIAALPNLDTFRFIAEKDTESYWNTEMIHEIHALTIHSTFTMEWFAEYAVPQLVQQTSTWLAQDSMYPGQYSIPVAELLFLSGLSAAKNYQTILNVVADYVEPYDPGPMYLHLLSVLDKYVVIQTPEWRPCNNDQLPPAYRRAMRTLLLLAKARCAGVARVPS